MRPLATASEMYSKCIVSPLMRQPMVITTSHCRDSARKRAARGSSKEPGTVASYTFASFTPHSLSAVRTPS